MQKKYFWNTWSERTILNIGDGCIMTETEKMAFLAEKIKALEAITQEITEVFPEKSFNLDGILIGNIVEVMAAHAYGISLYKQSEKTHDGEVIADGRKVQIKGTQKADSIVIREIPDFLLVEYLDKENGTIREIYNGPGDYVWKYASYVPSMNFYTFRVNKLLELDKNVPEDERIRQIAPVEKYIKNESVEDYSKNTKKQLVKTTNKRGKTLIAGYVNSNNQENMGCLNKPGNHYNQMAYAMRCNICGFEYEANGCDVAIRKCPNCM